MTRREILDAYLRDRAVEYGAKPVNGLVQAIQLPEKVRPAAKIVPRSPCPCRAAAPLTSLGPTAQDGDSYVVKYSNFEAQKGKGVPATAEFDIIVGADGANSRTAKAIDAGLYKIYITRTNSEGKDLPIYSNQNNDIAFDIEISGQAVFDPVPTQLDSSLTEVSSNVFASSALFGNLDRNFNHAQHSVAIYPTTYTGNVKVQASCLLGAPGSDDASKDWFDVTGNIAVSNSSDVFCRSFKVNANWVRVLSYPDNANSSIAKVQLRN